MTEMPEIEKDPDAVLDYIWSWLEWLGSDTISSSLFTVPTGLTKDSESNTATTATVWLSSGTAGENYTVLNHIVTVDGREDDRSRIIKVRER